jgi:hypothetical protein
MNLTSVPAPQKKIVCQLYNDVEPWSFPYHLLPAACKSVHLQNLWNIEDELYKLTELH